MGTGALPIITQALFSEPAPSHAAGQTSNARSHAGSPVSTRRGSRVESPPNAANSGQVRDQYPGFKQECNCQI